MKRKPVICHSKCCTNSTDRRVKIAPISVLMTGVGGNEKKIFCNRVTLKKAEMGINLTLDQ